MGNIILGFANVLGVVLDIYKCIIIIRALISWVNPDPYNPIVQALTRLTEPVLRPLRKLAPPYKVGVDLSPLIAILIILFLDYALIANLKQFGYSLR
jgi:YggT family protein